MGLHPQGDDRFKAIALPPRYFNVLRLRKYLSVKIFTNCYAFDNKEKSHQTIKRKLNNLFLHYFPAHLS